MTKKDETAVAVTGGGDIVPAGEPMPEWRLKPSMAIETFKEEAKEFDRFKAECLIENEDWGKVSGVPKRFLWKSGAEKIARYYGLVPEYEIMHSDERFDMEPPLIVYSVRCTLRAVAVNRVVSGGVGHANSREKQWRWRWVKGKREENEDLADQANTIIKIAKKRAYVDAVLTAVPGASTHFTQDPQAVGAKEDGITEAEFEEVDDSLDERGGATINYPGPEPAAGDDALVNPAKAKELEQRLEELGDEPKAWALRKMATADGKYKEVPKFTKGEAKALWKALDDNPPPKKRVEPGTEYHEGDKCGAEGCPGKMVLKPAGTSKEGKPYQAFLSCSDWQKTGCKFSANVPEEGS